MPSARVQCANVVLIQRAALAQVEANFSDAETSLQLAQAVMPMCSCLILDPTYSNMDADGTSACRSLLIIPSWQPGDFRALVFSAGF